jgi:hypothetical protein
MSIESPTQHLTPAEKLEARSEAIQARAFGLKNFATAIGLATKYELFLWGVDTEGIPPLAAKERTNRLKNLFAEHDELNKMVSETDTIQLRKERQTRIVAEIEELLDGCIRSYDLKSKHSEKNKSSDLERGIKIAA